MKVQAARVQWRLAHLVHPCAARVRQSPGGVRDGVPRFITQSHAGAEQRRSQPLHHLQSYFVVGHPNLQRLPSGSGPHMIKMFQRQHALTPISRRFQVLRCPLCSKIILGKSLDAGNMNV